MSRFILTTRGVPTKNQGKFTIFENIISEENLFDGRSTIYCTNIVLTPKAAFPTWSRPDITAMRRHNVFLVGLPGISVPTFSGNNSSEELFFIYDFNNIIASSGYYLSQFSNSQPTFTVFKPMPFLKSGLRAKLLDIFPNYETGSINLTIKDIYGDDYFMLKNYYFDFFCFIE